MANISFRTDLSSAPASLSTSNLPIPPSRIPRSAASSKVPDTIAHIRNICIHYIQTHMESGRITKESFRARHFDCSLLKRALVRVPQHRPQGGRHNLYLHWPWNGFIVLFETLGSTAAAAPAPARALRATGGNDLCIASHIMQLLRKSGPKRTPLMFLRVQRRRFGPEQEKKPANSGNGIMFEIC